MDVFREQERGMPLSVAELPGSGLPPLADLPAVDDQVMIVGHAPGTRSFATRLSVYNFGRRLSDDEAQNG